MKVTARCLIFVGADGAFVAATLMASLKAQITTLANTVAKIAKKVKA